MTTHFKWFVFVILAQAQVSAATQILTLDDAVQIAITNATSVLRAQNNEEAAAADVLKGYAQFLPDLKAGFSFGYEVGNRFSAQLTPTLVHTQNYGLAYQITSTLNLFNGLADLAALKSAIHRKQFAKLTIKRATQLVALDVAQSFLQVILDRKLVSIAQSALEASKAQQALIAEKVRLGSGNPSDLASQQAQTSTNESLLLNAQNQAKIDLLLLLQKLRLEVTDDYDLQEPKLNSSASLDPRYSDEAELLRVALDIRADLRSAKRTLAAASWDVTSAQSTYWPRLDAQFALFSNSRTLIRQTSEGTNYVPAAQDPLIGQLGAHNYFDLTLNLTWDIFDRWTTPRNVARASAVARNSRIDAEDQERQVQVDVKKALLDYQNGAKLVESTTVGAHAAQKAYDLVRGRFEEGIISFIDTQVAQATLVNAQSAHAQAVIGFELKKRALETAIGR